MATVADLASAPSTVASASVAASETIPSTTTTAATATSTATTTATTMQQGFIKLVQSGDTFLMQHPTRPIERALALAFIVAPRLARKSDESEDEPFAFEAREFVRKRCISPSGRVIVQFQVNYIIPQTKREFGTIWINGENLNLALVQAGLAKVKELRNNSPDFHRELWEAAQAAQAAGKGIWTQQQKLLKAAVRSVKWEDSYDSEKVYNDWKGKAKKAIVEFVLSGSTLRLLVLPTFHSVTLQLSGIQMLKSDAKKEETEQLKLTSKQIQAINTQAKLFTESKLLMREVYVLFEGVDKYGNIQGSLLQSESAQHAFQEELLSQGFAKIFDFSIAKTRFAPQLRAAETQAKEKRIRIFAGYVPPESHAKSNDFKNELSGQVVEVLSGDTIVILDKNTNTEVKVGLSSIRTPRPQVGGRKGPTDESHNNKSQPEPFGYDAKEFVRKMLIGRTVSVKVDYTREMRFGGANNKSAEVAPAAATSEEKPAAAAAAAEESGSNERRLFGTVLFQDKNINLELVKSGLATVIRHRSNEPKSAFIDLLYAAENEAKDARKGLHGNADKATNPKLNDLTLSTTTPKQAQQYFMFFQDKGRVRATVEKVFTGSRFKLIVPSTSIVLNFALQGIAAPSFNKSRQGSQPDPFARESLDFVRRCILQRDVDVELNSVDKNGTYVGFLFFGKKNLALEMLEHGFARPQLAVLEKSKYAVELKAAFEKAQAEKRAVWSVEAPVNPRWNRHVELPEEGESEATGEYDENEGAYEEEDPEEI